MPRPRRERFVPKRKPVNPFYVLLLLAGCAFAATASAYGVMTVRELHRSRNGIGDADGFTEIVDRHGANAMIVELVLLGLGTFGAIAFDQHQDKKAAPAGPVIANERTKEIS